MGSANDDDPFFEDYQEEYDAFFNEDVKPSTPTNMRSSVPRDGKGVNGGETAIESEYDLLTPKDKCCPTESTPRSLESLRAAADPGSAVIFSLDDGDSDGFDEHAAYTESHQDCRPPELPEPPADFSKEDLALREALATFYLRYNVENLTNINIIVNMYRGRELTHMWAKLAIKYRLSPAHAVELLASTLYESSPFECSDPDDALRLEDAMKEEPIAGQVEDRAELLSRLLKAASGDAPMGLLRVVCFRGVPGDEFRSVVWKVLLGHLPEGRETEWEAIQAEKRQQYADLRSARLVISDAHKFEIAEGYRDVESTEMLQQIQKDVDRTRQDCELFSTPASRRALVAILFVYAQTKPDVRYVQGMNEVVAVILYVMSADPDFAEADAYWCFSGLMEGIKPGFMESLDNSAEGIHAIVGAMERLLRTYDPELARHLHKRGSPQFVFAFRWCTMLFAQECSLPDVVRIWDSLLADPQRFDLVIHVCVALMLSCRDRLLAAEEHGELASILRAAPRHADVTLLLRRSWAICAFERRVQTPIFPVRSAAQLVGDLSDWAQGAAARAQEVTRSIQQNVAPVVKDQAQTKLGSLWKTVRATSAVAVSKTQSIAAEHGHFLAAVSSSVKGQAPRAPFAAPSNFDAA